jgi:membrane-associated phospholipid phosphatase
VQLRGNAVPGRGFRALLVLVCLLLVAACAVPAAFYRPTPLDRVVRRWVNAHQGRGAFAVLDAVTRMAHWQWVCLALVVLATALAIATSSLRPVRQAMLAVLVEVVAVGVLKAVFGRPGPTGVPPPPHDGAWPSGHAVALVVATVVVLRLFQVPRGLVSLAAFLPATVVSEALVYCGDHWFTDVVVAFPLGALLGWGALRAESWASTRIARPPPGPAPGRPARSSRHAGS